MIDIFTLFALTSTFIMLVFLGLGSFKFFPNWLLNFYDTVSIFFGGFSVINYILVFFLAFINYAN